MPPAALTSEEIAEAKEAFGLFDKNGDGKVTREELEANDEEIGVDLSSSELRKTIQGLDKDGSGVIAFDEFLAAAAAQAPQPAPAAPQDEAAEAKEAFLAFDRNGDGRIGLEELDAFHEEMGANPSAPELRRTIQGLDKDGNGTVDFKEFAGVIGGASQALDECPPLVAEGAEDAARAGLEVELDPDELGLGLGLGLGAADEPQGDFFHL
eukprot:tig00001021_g6300.t1